MTQELFGILQNILSGGLNVKGKCSSLTPPTITTILLCYILDFLGKIILMEELDTLKIIPIYIHKAISKGEIKSKDENKSRFN